MIFLIVMICLGLGTCGWMWWWLVRAPEGYEDAHGWHAGEPPTAMTKGKETVPAPGTDEDLAGMAALEHKR